MTRDDIIRMAREVDLFLYGDAQEAAIERFFHAAFAAGEAAERDRTLRAVEDMQTELRQRRMTARNT